MQDQLYIRMFRLQTVFLCSSGMAFVRRLLNRGSTPKSQHVNGAPAAGMTTEDATSQMAGLSLGGAAAEDKEVATFALS